MCQRYLFGLASFVYELLHLEAEIYVFDKSKFKVLLPHNKVAYSLGYKMSDFFTFKTLEFDDQPHFKMTNGTLKMTDLITTLNLLWSFQ